MLLLSLLLLLFGPPTASRPFDFAGVAPELGAHYDWCTKECKEAA
jgi:hypothetical protein